MCVCKCGVTSLHLSAGLCVHGQLPSPLFSVPHWAKRDAGEIRTEVQAENKGPFFFSPGSANHMLQELRECLDVPNHKTHLIISPSFPGTSGELLMKRKPHDLQRVLGFLPPSLEQTHL